MTTKFLKSYILLAFIFIILSCRTSKNHSDCSEQYSGTPPDFLDELPVGVPAFPDTIHYKLPDDYILRLFLQGDEHYHLAKTIDHFLILMNPEGFYEYAIYDDQGLPKSSGIIARNPEDRTDEDWRILNAIKRNH